ncbi:MAG: hypothetical protein OHK0038_26590 [Flammeovirgaceae bacterium]
MTEERIQLFKMFNENFIGSRYAGEIVRQKIDEAINNGKIALIDFTGINWITQSFGDEIVGIYVRAFGVDFVKKNIKIENANDEIRKMLNLVVGYSKKMSNVA